MAIEIETPRSTPKPAGAIHLPWSRNRVTARERMFFTERLALLLETGTALHASLETLSSQVESPALREIVAHLAEDVSGGLSLSQGLARHPRVFSTAYVNLVGASEQGGFLPEVLGELMAMEEKQAELRSTLVSALSYPAFLIVFSVAVVVFVLMFVFPKFASLFTMIHDQLPITTLALMATSDFLRHYWAIVGGALAAVGLFIGRWLQSAGGRTAIDGLKLRLPVLRTIYAQLYLTQLMRVMGLSLDRGVSVPDALRACRDVVRNRVFQALITRLEAEVNEGRGIAAGFQDAAFIPDLVKQMISTGEETGRLALVMRRIADFYQRELGRRLAVLSKLVEPVMLLVMGVVVGIVVSSLILPIFKLAHTVH